MPLVGRSGVLVSERRPPEPGPSPDCEPARAAAAAEAGETEEQVRSSPGTRPLRITAPATPTLGPSRPHGSRPAGRDPLPHAACANDAENVGRSGSVKQIVICTATPAGPGEFAWEQSGTRSEGRGGRPRPRPVLAPPTPNCAPRPSKSFLPVRSVKVGRGATSLSPGRGNRGSAPPTPAGALGTDLRHRPQLRASPVAVARPQSHRQVQALPRREPAERSR